MAIFNSYVCLPELIYLYTHFASSASFSCSYLQFLSGSYNYIWNMRMYGCQICFQNVIYNENRHISWHIRQFLHVLSTCFVTSHRPECSSRPPRQSCARNAASWAAARVWRDERFSGRFRNLDLEVYRAKFQGMYRWYTVPPTYPKYGWLYVDICGTVPPAYLKWRLLGTLG